ncbi:MAG TPA: hypothetical protein VFK31_06460 [Rhodanobacteraceae bacterium]|nr:hypothetical protein [Rhodanobacteraceae bacterium]
MAELEGEHTRAMEQREQSRTHFGIRLGQLMAFTITGGGIIGAIHLAMHNHDNVAMVIGGVPLATIVVAFLQGKPKKG